MGSARELLRLVHERPGISRADAARALGIGSGAATELVAKLAAATLLGERAAPPTGGRGRPTTLLGAHPAGPVVVAISITYEAWRIRVVELGGTAVASAHGDHPTAGFDDVRSRIMRALRPLRRRFGDRISGIGISVPGIVVDGILLEAGHLGWAGVDLARLARPGEVLVAGNDATLAATAESHRGRAAGSTVALHVRLEAGIGGGVVDRGRTARGALGVAGEFGHMPFGDLRVRCPCGAWGCWGNSVDGAGLARLLGHPPPTDSVGYFRRVIRAATAGGTAESAAVHSVTAVLGRGIAGLVNGLDPDVVTVGGLGVLLMELAPDVLQQAYLSGLMSFRSADPPVLAAAVLGEDGPLYGAAELIWQQLWERLAP